jgi:hypothetical protein
MVAYPIGFFFAATLSALSKTTAFYLAMKKLKMKQKLRQLKRKIGSILSGVGIAR